MDNSVFKDEKFWLFYHGIKGLDEAELEALGIGESFDKKGHPMPMEIQFDCGKNYRIELSISLEQFAIDLWIVDKKSKQGKNLAWWSEEDWHPFVFRWEELFALIDYWAPDERNPSREVFLGLFARFTGNAPAEFNKTQTWESRVDILRNAYLKLGLSLPVIEKILVDSIFLEKDYSWKSDSKLGWVFTGEYACYSIRNAEHVGGENEFPFAWYRTLLEDIGYHSE